MGGRGGGLTHKPPQNEQGQWALVRGHGGAANASLNVCLEMVSISTLSPVCSVGPQATGHARRAATQPQKQCGEVKGALDLDTWVCLRLTPSDARRA